MTFVCFASHSLVVNMAHVCDLLGGSVRHTFQNHKLQRISEKVPVFHLSLRLLRVFTRISTHSKEFLIIILQTWFFPPEIYPSKHTLHILFIHQLQRTWNRLGFQTVNDTVFVLIFTLSATPHIGVYVDFTVCVHSILQLTWFQAAWFMLHVA